MESIGDGTKMGIAKAAAAGQRKAERGIESELATPWDCWRRISCITRLLFDIPNVDLSL